MTAPVVVTPDSASTMQFIMPTAFKSVRHALTPPFNLQAILALGFPDMQYIKASQAVILSARSPAVFSVSSVVVVVGVVDGIVSVDFVVAVDGAVAVLA